MFFFSFGPGTGPKKIDDRHECGGSAHHSVHFMAEYDGIFMMGAHGFARRNASRFVMQLVVR